jgi:hypothetical protein
MFARLAIVAAAVAALALACGGGDSSEPSPAASPAGPLPPSGEAAAEALGSYLQESGLSDFKGDLTSPLDCAAAQAEEAAGDFCVAIDAGHYAAGVVIFFVTHRDSGESWQVHLSLDQQEDAWAVSQVEYIQPEDQGD